MKITHLIRVTATALAIAFASTAYAGGLTIGENKDSKLTFGGKMFTDLTVKDVDGVKTQGLNLTRFYLDTKYKKNNWLARVTTDINNEQPNATGLKRQMNVFLKYAYLEGTFSDALQLRLGLSHTPWIDYEQKLWKHRFVAKVASDHYKFDDSADYGIGLKGKLADGLVNYWVTLTNGAGYSKPNSNGSMDYNTRLTIKPIKGLDISGQYRAGYRGKKATTAAVTPAAKETLMQFLASYGNKQWRVGGNYIKNKNSGNTSNVDYTVLSGWGWVELGGDFGLFGKIEQNKDDNQVKFNKKRHYIAGVDFFVQKGLTMTVAYDDEKTTALPGKVNSTTKKYGLYSQFKF